MNHPAKKRRQEYKGDQSADVRSGRLHEGARKAEPGGDRFTIAANTVS